MNGFMNEFIKKQSAGLFLSLATILLLLVGLFFYIKNGNSNYYHDFNSFIVIISLAIIGIEVMHLVLVRLIGEKQWMDIVYIVVPVLLVIAAITFISYRVESAGIILASDLEKGNMEAIHALNQAFFGIAFYLLAMVAGVIGSFFNQLKAK